MVCKGHGFLPSVSASVGWNSFFKPVSPVARFLCSDDPFLSVPYFFRRRIRVKHNVRRKSLLGPDGFAFDPPVGAGFTAFDQFQNRNKLD
jgi:hypothetical protein